MTTEIEKLESLFDSDQSTIRELKAGLIDEATFTARRQANAAYLTDYINNKGFPFKNKTSQRAYFAAFLVVLHSEDMKLMNQVIDIFSHSSNVEIDMKDKAYLIDKARVFAGQPQIYGTQYKKKGSSIEFFSIEDESNVDTRRAEVGLSALADYRTFILKG